MTARPPDDHLSEQELSDLVDGQAGSQAAAHVSRCPSCTARLDGWKLMAARMAAPVPVPIASRERAVEAAMAGVGSGEADPRGGGSGDGSGPGSGSGSGDTGRRGLRVLSGLAAAAAVVLALGVGLSQLDSSGSAHKTSSSSATSPGPNHAAAAAGRETPSGGFSLSTAEPDLGPIDGPPALVAAVNRALRPAARASAGGATSGTSTVSNAGAAPISPQSQTAAAGSCAIPTGVFPSGSPPPLLLHATARYRAVPADVSVYQVVGGLRAVVIAQKTCAVLADVPF